MTIEAGVLSLRITETGADQVEKKLGDIDKKATALGSQPIAIHLTAPGIERLDNQLEQLGKQATLYRQGAQFASTKTQSLRELGAVEKDLRGIIASGLTPLEQRIKAERTLAGLTKDQSLSGMALAKSLAVQYLGYQLLTRAIGGYVTFIDNAIQAGDRLHDLSMRTGVSVPSLSILAPIAEKSGASLDDLTIGFRKLSRELELLFAGNKKATESFKALGLTAADLTGLSLDQVLVKIADAQEKMADGGQKNALMTELFGRSGEKLIPTLHELADGGFDRARASAEKFGNVMTTEFADKADKFGDAVVDLKSALGGLGMLIADSILPGLTDMTTRLAGLIGQFNTMSVRSPEWAKAIYASIAGALNILPGGAIIADMLPSAADVDRKAHPFTVMGPTPAQLRAGRRAPIVITAEQQTAADRAATRLDDERARALAKVPDLSGIPIRDLVSTTPRGPEPTVGVGKDGKMKGVGKFGIGDVVDKEFDELAKKITDRQRQLGELMQGVGDILGNALSAGVTAAFKGGNFFAEMGKALLTGIGGMLVQLGSSMLTYGLLMAVGLPLLIATPFAAQALSAPAAIAAGTGLIALGAGLGAIGGGAKGAGGGAGGSGAHPQNQPQNQFEVAFDPDKKLRRRGPAVVPSSRSLNNGPMPEGRPTVVIGTINSLSPDDAKWQRAVAETYMNAQGRGLIRKSG